MISKLLHRNQIKSKLRLKISGGCHKKRTETNRFLSFNYTVLFNTSYLLSSISFLTTRCPSDSISTMYMPLTWSERLI